MLSVAAMSSGQERYYLHLAREDYYLAGGEPPGLWLGQGARGLGLTGLVEPGDLRAVLAGFSPGGDALVQNAGAPGRQIGWDLTVSVPKTVSVLWSQSPLGVRREIEAAHRAGFQAMVDYLEGAAARTRRGHGGEEREPAGLVVAAFEHGTSRALDPQLHSHLLVANVGTRADGTIGSLESRPLYQHKMTAGALYRAELSAQLQQRLGLDVERVQGWFEIAGVPPALVREFSQRRADVVAEMEARGVSGARAAAAATLETRGAKAAVPREELFAEWGRVGERHGWDPGGVAAGGGRVPPGAEKPDVLAAAAAAVTRGSSHFSEREFLRAAAEEAQGRRIPAALLVDAARAYLRDSPDVVALGGWRGESRFTTCEMMDLEADLLARVGASRERHAHPVDRAVLADAVAAVEQRRGAALGGEQRMALEHITRRAGDIQVVSGLAGTGKSTLLEAAARAWEGAGYTVRGVALAGKAAEGLTRESGIESTTLARLFWQIDRGDRLLGPGTVLVVDEAGMVGTRQMARAVAEAERAGAKLVLVGDARQLQPIEAGGPFAAIGERLGEATLTEIRRQREGWAREAVGRMAGGEAGAALAAFAARGLVSVAEDAPGARAALIAAWRARGLERPEDALILAGGRDEAARLNRDAQAERLRAGALGTGRLECEGATFYEGDRLLFTRNSRVYGVTNGSLGTVTGVDAARGTLLVTLDGGGQTVIPTAVYGHLSLGYALTTHKGQGVTVEEAFVLAGGAMQDRELSYVQISRSRGDTRIFVAREDAGEGLTDLARTMRVSRQKTLAHEVRPAGVTGPQEEHSWEAIVADF